MTHLKKYDTESLELIKRVQICNKRGLNAPKRMEMLGNRTLDTVVRKIATLSSKKLKPSLSKSL